MPRRLACLALLMVAGLGRADGFADDLRYRGKTLTEWLQQLKSDDRAVSLAASRALVYVGPEAQEAAPALLMALKNDDPVVRDRVADALSRIGKDAVPLLAAAL